MNVDAELLYVLVALVAGFVVGYVLVELDQNLL